MRPQQYVIWIAFVFAGLSVHSQEKSGGPDTTLSFKVFGVCEQCKRRIETAAKGKGVRSAIWDVDSKQLELTFSPGETSVQKIQNRILGVGHDLETKKAKDIIYNELPSCCHYREMDKMMNDVEVDSTRDANSSGTTTSLLLQKNEFQNRDHFVKGIVLESNKKGVFVPLPGASVIWLGTNKGTSTDSNGIFSIKPDAKTTRLVISYSGYKADTIAVSEIRDLKIILGSRQLLQEVVVNARERSFYLSATNTARTEIMTDKELFKAACCNLSESFETNPSVDVSYNDAVTGSKQIQLLGLSGNYTQLTIENLPGPRGIATSMGLNSIAGPWVESIQLTKGIGSVANGYESIAGQINVELKKPETSEHLFANAYINDFGKTDVNLNLAEKLGKKWSVGLLLHDDFLNKENLDFNKDGFRDLPTGNQFSLINRWKYDDGKGFLSQFGFKMLNDNRTGGETAYDPSSDKYTTNHYGLGIDTRRYEAFAKIGYVFPQKKYKSIGLQLSAVDHSQDSYFGLTTYNAKQKTFYSNLIYQSIINTTIHKFRTGFSFLVDDYNENFKSMIYKRTEIVPGAFFEYTYTPSDKITIEAGLRADHDNLFGFFVTPRLHLRYAPVKGTTFRMSAGRGQRTANIFAENTGVFVSARQVQIITTQTGKAYGLNPEIAWNKGISFDQNIKLFHRTATASLDFFRNDFKSQVVVDLEDPRTIRFYELQGKSYSNSFQAELNVEPVNKLSLRIAYRYFDVKTTYGSKLLQRPLTASNRAFVSLDYAINGWKFDYTLNYNGKKRIPNTSENPAAYQRPDYSPSFIVMNAQITKTLGRKRPMDFYIGGENLSNYYQNNAIIAASQPFSPYFDASLVWGPVTGRMFYAGWRLKIK